MFRPPYESIVPRFVGDFHKLWGVNRNKFEVKSKILERETQVFRHVPDFRVEVLTDSYQSIREVADRLKTDVLENIVKFEFGVHLVPPYGSSVSHFIVDFHSHAFAVRRLIISSQLKSVKDHARSTWR